VGGSSIFELNEPKMSDIYLVRHGQSTWNDEHRWAGVADPPLTDLGRLQAKQACSKLGEMGFRSVTSSALCRARETASIIANELSLELAPLISELNERQAGEICGLTSQEIDLRYPGLLDQWRAGQVIEISGGEAWSVFTKRVFQGLCVLSSFSGPIIVVSHEGVLRALEYLLGEKQVRHENLEGKWIKILNRSLQPIA
jgi:broad specificity phosphatase PhoE